MCIRDSFTTEGAAPAALPIATQSRSCDVCTVAEARDAMIRLGEAIRKPLEEPPPPVPIPTKVTPKRSRTPAYVSIALGLWLMFAPFTLGSVGMVAHSDHLVGALIVTAAVIALADVGRATRFINILFGAWIIAAPWLLDGATTGSKWNDLIVGALVILVSFPRGPVGERYGDLETFIR